MIYNNALNLLKSGKLQTALEKLTEAYMMIPTYTNIHFQLSLVHYHLGDFTKAEKHISEFFKSKPTDLQGIKLGINIYSKLGKEKEKKYLMNVYNELENT